MPPAKPTVAGGPAADAGVAASVPVSAPAPSPVPVPVPGPAEPEQLDPATDAATDPAAGPPKPKRGMGTVVRVAFLLLALALGVYAIARQWTQVRSGLADLGPVVLGASLVITVAAWLVMMAAWRGLLYAFGSLLPWRGASRVFFLGQLGKYVPGSVWPVIAQMELGRAYHVPRRRSATVAVLAMLVSLAAAILVAAATLPWAADNATDGYRWAFAAAPVLLACLHPRVANPALDTLFRLTRRPPLEQPLSGRALATAASRSIAGWVLAGIPVWLMAVQLGAPAGRTFLLAVGGFAFAWSVGFLVILAPAGAGVREVILVAALSPVLDPGQATAVAVASRLVTIAADLVAAAVAASLGRAGSEPPPAED